MSLRNRDVRLSVLNLRNKRMLQDQKNVPLSSILTNRSWSRPEEMEATLKGGNIFDSLKGIARGDGELKGGRAIGCGKKQSQQDKEDEKLGEEVGELKGDGGYTGASAKKLGEAYAKEIMENEGGLRGSGFLGDFWKGFKSVVNPVASVVSKVGHLIPHPYAQAVATGADVTGALTGGNNGTPSPPPEERRMKKQAQMEKSKARAALRAGLQPPREMRGPATARQRRVARALRTSPGGSSPRREDDDGGGGGGGGGDDEGDGGGGGGGSPGMRRPARKHKVRKHKVKKHGKGKRKMNAYMLAVQSARKSGAKSFEYKGKKYVRAKTKTGMVIFRKG